MCQPRQLQRKASRSGKWTKVRVFLNVCVHFCVCWRHIKRLDVWIWSFNCKITFVWFTCKKLHCVYMNVLVGDGHTLMFSLASFFISLQSNSLWKCSYIRQSLVAEWLRWWMWNPPLSYWEVVSLNRAASKCRIGSFHLGKKFQWFSLAENVSYFILQPTRSPSGQFVAVCYCCKINKV